MNTDLATLRALYVTTRNERAMGAQIDTRHVFGMLEGAPADVLAAFAPKPSDVTVTAADVAAHSYANGDFDLAQSVAQRLTDEDRAAGRPAPAYGYSAENIARAWGMIAAAAA